jgi:hypothetical protein
MKFTLLDGAGVLMLMACVASTPAQTTVIPGQMASASERSAFNLSAYGAPGGNSLAVSPKIDIANAEDRHDTMVRHVWVASICAMLGAAAMDAGTSWGKYEKNSLLASSDGKFGAKGLSMKAGFAGAVMVPQLLLRKRKDFRMKFAIANFAEAAASSGLAIHNLSIAAPKGTNWRPPTAVSQ